MQLNFLILGIVSIVTFSIAPHYSFLLGLVIALSFKIDSHLKIITSKYSKKILQTSIILLGAKLDLSSIFTIGEKGILLTFISIIFIFTTGYMLSKIFKVSDTVSTLISSGTSICGGSAISAVAPVINANGVELATAMGVVFILNAIAIFIFPPIAQYLNLSQDQFGTWAALAIHDTSSVVAATQIYGEQALKVGTTLKLLRSLWIIPLVLFISLKNKQTNSIKIPWFILGFISLSILFSYFESLSFLKSPFSDIAKTGLSVTLFLIGLNLSKNQLTNIGTRPLLLGLSLWVLTILSSLILVKSTIL